MWIVFGFLFVLLAFGLAEPLIQQHWHTSGVTTGNSTSTPSLVDQSNVIAALVALVALLIAAAGGSSYLVLRNRIQEQVHEQLEIALDEITVSRAVQSVDVYTSLLVLLWTWLGPLMQKRWENLAQSQRAERLSLLAAAQITARVSLNTVVQYAEVTKGWPDGDPQLSSLRLGAMNCAFYEACWVVQQYRETKSVNAESARRALEAIDLVELKLGRTPRKPRAFLPLETWCWVVLTCTRRSSPDARLDAAKAELRRLLDPAEAISGVDDAARRALRQRYEASGFEIDMLEPLLP